MGLEVWVGRVEVRQLPGLDQKITLSGKGAFTRVTCWASDVASFEKRVSRAMAGYGLFIVDLDKVMPFAKAQKEDIVTDELLEQFEDTSENEQFCIYGTFHNYMSDN